MDHHHDMKCKHVAFVALWAALALARAADDPTSGALGGGPVKKVGAAYYQFVSKPASFRDALLNAAMAR